MCIHTMIISGRQYLPTVKSSDCGYITSGNYCKSYSN